MPQDSSSQNITDLFGEALSLQQQKKWDEAMVAYNKITVLGLDALSPAQASVVYNNMAVITAQKSDLLNAYIWSRKAFELNPSNSQAKQSFEHFSTQFQIPSLPHQISDFDRVQHFLEKTPIDLWFFASTLSLFLLLFFVAQNVVKSTQNKAKDVFEKLSWWKAYLTAAFAVFLMAFTFLAYNGHEKITGLVKTDKAAIQTVPGENKPVIFEAQAGLELEVLAEQDSFYQVRYAGAFSGWISKTQIELLSLSFEQNK